MGSTVTRTVRCTVGYVECTQRRRPRASRPGRDEAQSSGKHSGKHSEVHSEVHETLLHEAQWDARLHGLHALHHTQ